MAQSFKRKYRGAAVDGFQEYLTHNERLFNESQGTYLAKLCTVIQSSGTGKSRMLTELGKKDVIVIYMNIRDRDGEYSFPRRDQIPADILTNVGYKTEEKCEVVCYTFFIALFNTIKRILSKHLGTENARARILEWRKQMCDISCPPMTTTRADFMKKLDYNYYKANKHVGDTSLKDMLVKSFKKLSTLLAQTFPDHSFEPKLVIAIDNASPLMKGRIYRPADVLCNVVREYSYLQTHVEAVWVVLASTGPDLLPRVNPYESGSIAIQREKLFPAFTQLGWDQNASPLEGIDVEKISQARHIAGYGRPLWLSLTEGDHYISRSVLNLASWKLCGNWYNPAETDQALAVLGQRFAMNITLGHRDSFEYSENGVGDHLRICHATTMDRKCMITSYPSEPFLSCVAAIGLHGNFNLGTSLYQLERFIKKDMIDVGQRGELVSRFLWLLAKDLFIRKRMGLPNEFPHTLDGDFIDCRMISVVDWLEFVFGPRIWSEENSEALFARKKFENAYLNFSHWVCMDTNLAGSGDEDELPLDLLTLRLWQRTSAVQCWHQQPLVGKVIPMYFKDESIASTKGRMSQIFISDSICELSNSKNGLHSITRRHRNVGGDVSTGSDSGSLPYIAIMTDLGQPPSLSVSLTEGDASDCCLRIYAAGVDTSTYPFLDKYPQVMMTLQSLVHMQRIPEMGRPCREHLGGQVRFGNSPTATSTGLERGAVPSVLGKRARGSSS